MDFYCFIEEDSDSEEKEPVKQIEIKKKFKTNWFCFKFT